MIKPLKLSN